MNIKIEDKVIDYMNKRNKNTITLDTKRGSC